MRTFYSPAERALLRSLPEQEAAVVEALMQELDAHLVEESEEEQQTLFRNAA